LAETELVQKETDHVEVCSMQEEKGFRETVASNNRATRELQSVSLRALLIGIVILVALSFLIQYSGLTGLIPSIETEIVPSPAGMTGVFLLMMINLLASRFGKRLKFSQGELVTVYSMIMLGGLMMGRGLVAYQIVNIMAVPLFAVSVSSQFYGPILNRLHNVTTPKSMRAVSGFWKGGANSVPWVEWIGPILFWVSLFAVLFFLMMCMTTLVRRRWTDHEHLAYPLVTPVINMTKVESDDVGLPSFWNNRLVLVGAIWPVVVSIMNTVHLFLPAVPSFPVGYPIYEDLAGLNKPWNALGAWPYTWLAFQPLQIGVGYLLSTQITLSMWFFYVVERVSIVLMEMGGYATYNGLQLDQQRGAYIALALTSLWLARGQIRESIQKALGGSIDIDDSNEPLSFRTAFWGLILGLVVVVLALQIFIGISVWVSLLALVICYSVVLGFARIRVEAGFLYSWGSPNYLGGQLVKMFGKSTFGDHNATALGYFTPFDMGHFSSGAGVLLEGYKLGDLTGIKRRSMSKALFLAFLVAVVMGYVVSLPIIYKNGMFNLDSVRIAHAANGNIFSWASTPIKRVPQVFTMHGIGFGVTGILAFMQTKFVWWPFSPLGFVLAQGVYMNTLASNAFFAWLIKSAVYRYGGHKLYSKLLPLFFGIIAGSVVAGVVTSVASIIVNLLVG
jgi:hypothetical protein